MFRICKVGMIFIRKSKMLSFSAFLSIFVACFLSISMFQLSSSVESSVEKGMEAKKGAFDLKVTKNEGESFYDEEIRSFEQEKAVKDTSGGYQTDGPLNIYMVGVEDDEINRSLYKYTEEIAGNRIVINESLGRRENKNVGDIFSVGGREFQIVEVVKTDSMSDYKMPMAIMELSQIHQLLGHADSEQVNYMLLQFDDSVYNHIEYENLARRIQSYNPDYQVSDQRLGNDYDTVLKSIRMIFRTFFVVIITISGLFVVNIFMEYMRKYRKDMAVFRIVGGSQEQVQAVFCSMSVIISAGGCLAGAVFSAIVSGVVLNWLNDKTRLFDGSVSLNGNVLWQITLVVFVLFNIFVYVVFRSGQRVLPVQVFQETSSELRKSRKANRFLVLRRVFGKSGYLGMKLMAPKFRRNFMIIIIIALITALSYTGQASLKLLKSNDNWYHYHSMDGKMAKGEIWTESPLSLHYVRELNERFESVRGNGYLIYGDFALVSGDEADPDLMYFNVADLEALPQFRSAEVWEKYGEVPKIKRLVMEESVAVKKGCKLGDTVALESDYLGGKKEFVLVQIVNADHYGREMYNMIVDWDNLCEKESTGTDTGGSRVGLWLDGDKERIRDKFQQLQVEAGIYFDGSIYDDVMEQSDQIVSQWTTTMHIVLAMLLIVAGIGLLNSANGMLLTRRKEYKVFRMLGATRKTVRRICWMQTWSYMLSGVVLGAILGIVVVACLWNDLVITNTPVSTDWQYIAGIVAYLFGLSLTLYPTIRKMG